MRCSGVMHLYRALIVITLAVGLMGCGKGPQGEKGDPGPVSYTHLTLPTNREV